MVLCHPRWLPTSGLTEFALCWGGAGFEPRTTALQSGALPLSQYPHAELTRSNNMRKLSMSIMTYLIEYLGEFKLILETILEYESGTQMGSFDAKNRHRKSHAWAPLS
jgi:hypothetical protein